MMVLFGGLEAEEYLSKNEIKSEPLLGIKYYSLVALRRLH
ncbi:hypothetical protein A2U01_0091362 [Trifolium medium]|uniref:Uncharacterized protein n=1 Tax=Trifolium medium TaxID=97028 RepID=A0A392U9B8_9FABA|nr:hypothetical protein [Trifolium medium]